MCDIALIILASGNSSRLNLPCKKQWLRIGSTPLWLFCANKFAKQYKFKNIIIAGDDIKYMKKFAPQFTYVKGGDTRQESLKNALELIDTKWVMATDCARANIPTKMIDDLISNLHEDIDCIVPVIKVSDSVYFGNDVADRNKISLVQTPQLSKTQILKKAVQNSTVFTDDSSAIKSMGGVIKLINGDIKARKITYLSDLLELSLPKPSSEIFSGNGFDVHRFGKGDHIVLCGEKIPFTHGFIAHSDGDVAIHALIDAMLGACGMGDIGELYPDNDPRFAGINSLELLKDTFLKISSVGYEIINADITIIAEKPKLKEYKEKMQINIAKALGIMGWRINVKATTTEQLGFTGRKEGIAALANVNLKFFDWKNYESFNS